MSQILLVGFKGLWRTPSPRLPRNSLVEVQLFTDSGPYIL
jgi:hypothetical protein